ncbi:MAG: S1 RNA-binding domain-containing protein [Anaerolineae bacterium]
MSDELTNDTTPNGEPEQSEEQETSFAEMMSDSSFSEMLEEYGFDQPRRGQLLTGLVVQATPDEIILDVGMKNDAIVPRSDLERLDPETLASLVPGAEVTVYVVNPQSKNGDLIVSVYRALSAKDWDRARELMESNEIVEAEVVDTNRGGLLVQFGLLRGFVPQSLLGNGGRSQRGKRNWVGKKLRLKVIEVNQQRNRLVFSEKAAREEVRREQIAGLEVGARVTGRVVSLVDYGAFVDIGGVDGLIHISKLDWQHIKHPSEVLAVGDEVEVQIDDVDVERERISLNRKVLLPSPWETIAQKYQQGDLVTGKVTNIADFGIFIELAPSIEGLVHLSEMSKYGSDPHSVQLEKGEEVLVRIINIDPDRQRIALSLDRITEEEQTDWLAERAKMAHSAQAEEDEAELEAEDEFEAEAEAVAEDEPVAELEDEEVVDVEEDDEDEDEDDDDDDDEDDD